MGANIPVPEGFQAIQIFLRPGTSLLLFKVSVFLTNILKVFLKDMNTTIKERDRETERQRQREAETETETGRDRDRDRETETERESERDRDRERLRERQRESRGKVVKEAILVQYMI